MRSTRHGERDSVILPNGADVTAGVTPSTTLGAGMQPWVAPDGGPSVRLRAIAFVRTKHVALGDALADQGAELIQRLEGLLIAAFTSSSAALRALGSLPTDATAGASCGDVLCENEVLYGLPVIEASRLLDDAAPGQILCTNRLIRSAEPKVGTHGGPAPRKLRGIPVPIPVCELVRDA